MHRIPLPHPEGLQETAEEQKRLDTLPDRVDIGELCLDIPWTDAIFVHWTCLDTSALPLMQYLTIKQAAEATHKSEKTIRRLCSSPQSKNYVTEEEGRIMVAASYLQQVYPMSTPGHDAGNGPGQSLPMSTQNVHPPVQAQGTHAQDHEIALLKLQLRHKDEMLGMKDRQIEILERSLLLLGEGPKPDLGPAAVSADPIPQATLAPERKKRWWQF